MNSLDDDSLRQLRATFKLEAAEHIQAMNHVLLAIESNPESGERAAGLEEIFREAHSLRGAAGAADLPPVEQVAYRLESLFGAARAGRITLTREACDLLFRGIDAVSVIVETALTGQPHGIDLPGLLAQLEAAADGRLASPDAFDRLPEMTVRRVAPAQPDAAPESPGDATQSTRSAGSTGEETIRVATRKIDALLTQAGELLAAGLKIDLHLKEVEQASCTLEAWQREWLRVRAAVGPWLRGGNPEARSIGRFLELNQTTLRSLAAQVADLRRAFARDALHLSRATHALSEGVMQARMLPVAAVFDAFPRLVRDLARDSGKEIALQLLGADTELDRKVLEAIKDPLIHLLRNAVDHGIEPPDARERAGKPRQGTIAVRAFQKGNRILVEVADDGAGINRDRVRQAALKAGLIGADEAETLADERVLRLIFEAGLSTSPIVTGLSGRGVGMGVVRQNVEALHGQAAVDSTPGRGTTITLALPLTMATMQQVLVQAGDQTYGIPVSAVERIQRIDPKDIGRVAGRQAIAFNGEPIALARLADVLEQPAAGQPDEIDASPRVLAVILNALGQRAAFQVDAVLGQQEMVVNSLGRQLARVRNVAGATILGSGQVVLILNPADLLKSVWAMPDRPDTTPPPARRPDRRSRQATILVVDDSLSLRTLERNILEAAGYTVMVAGDGLEALRLLNSKSRCDLIVSDVMMPHMTGLELTAAVRQQPALKHIPVVLVTSLGSREDMERGIEVGADAYLVKDSFEQSDLLGTIEQLI